MAKQKADELPCPKCKESIKAAASKCKHCGHEMTSDEVKKRVEENGNAQAVGAGCVLLIAGAIFLAFCASGGDDEESGAGSETDSAQAAVERKKGFHCLSSWDGSHRGFKQKVKNLLRDPDSFEHIETRVTPVKDGKHTILMKYRARNGFGGMNVGAAIGSFDNATCTASDPVMSD